MLDRPQLPVELARLDGAQHRREDRRQLGRLAGRDEATRDRGGDRAHRRREVGGVAQRRQRDRLRPLAARRDRALEAEAHRQRVAGQRQLDRLAGQGLRLAVKIGLGGARRLVAAAAAPPGRVAGLALGKRPPARPILPILRYDIGHPVPQQFLSPAYNPD